MSKTWHRKRDYDETDEVEIKPSRKYRKDMIRQLKKLAQAEPEAAFDNVEEMMEWLNKE